MKWIEAKVVFDTDDSTLAGELIVNFFFEFDLQGVVEEFGPFDLIIDDGSHIASHMLASFNYLFLEGLNDAGIYFVEDTHSNYFQSHRDTEFSFMDMAKSLVDAGRFTEGGSPLCPAKSIAGAKVRSAGP